MPKKIYNLATPETNQRKLEVVWNTWGTKYNAFLDGQPVGEFTAKEINVGKEILLHDGSILKLKMVRSFLTFELQVSFNNQAVPGSAADPKERVKQAQGVALFIGALSFILGLLAELVPIKLLLETGIGYIATAEGAIFLIFAWFIHKQKAWAAFFAAALLILDTLGYIYASVTSPNASVGAIIGPLFVKIYFIVFLFRGFRALREIKNTRVLDSK